MTLLTVNTGSSSTRIAAFRSDGGGGKRLVSAQYNAENHSPRSILDAFLAEIDNLEVEAIVHRIVHGGEALSEPCLINKDVEREIQRLSELAPLHNPLALSWIQACREILGPQLLQIAVFDTGFYANLPAVAATYALPHDLSKKYGLRRYGFHGIAHQAMWERWRKLRPDLKEGGRIISIQLGSGCSITAIERGRPEDTSMGFSPLEGLVMATRCGDLDPGLITYLLREDFTLDEVENMLNTASGLLGLSGKSEDMRVLFKTGNSQARLAVSLYCYRVRKYLGAYLAVLGGAEGVVFGGGVGENSPPVREQILKNMEWLGIELDPEANAAAIGREAKISTSKSGIDVWVISVDEAAILANEGAAVLERLEKGEVK